MPAEKDITVTLVANAGIYVQYDGIGILVDGIHHERAHNFSLVSREDLACMGTATAPYDGLAYLLFTHEHPDHMTPSLVRGLIKQRQQQEPTIQGVLLPQRNIWSQELSRLYNSLQKYQIPYATLSLEPGHVERYTLAPHNDVTVFGTRHVGRYYHSMRNDCLALTIAGVTLLFTGDADPTLPEPFMLGLKGLSVDAIFINSVFYHMTPGQKILQNIVQPKQTIIYHLPFPEDDALHILPALRKDIERFQASEPTTIALTKKRQTITFKTQKEQATAPSA